MSRLATRFANPTQYRSDAPISNDIIRQIAPSIFATEAHESRSSRYTFVPTIDVLEGLRREGFEPFMVGQSRTRVPGKAEFTKHMLRLRHASQINGEEANEIILVNSHDGTSSYQMLAGQFRFVCMNGMVCGDTFGEIKVHHKGNIVDDVIEGAFTVVDSFEQVTHQREEMKALPLLAPERAVFGQAALDIRYGTDEKGNSLAPITVESLLRPRRWQDHDKNNLWETFNTVQENMIKGGLRGRTATNRRTSTREVSGIDQNVKLNRALWTLAERMAELKAAA